MWDWRAKRGHWSRASWHTIPTGRYKLVSSREDASGIPYQGARFPDFPPSKLGGNPEAGATPLRGHDKHRERERESFETRALVMATSAHSSAIVLEFHDATPPLLLPNPRIDKIHSRLCGTGHQMENKRTRPNRTFDSARTRLSSTLLRDPFFRFWDK